MFPSIPLKKCTKCGIEKPATTEYFHRDKNRPSGLFSHCKQCVRNYHQEYDRRPNIRIKQREYAYRRLQDPTAFARNRQQKTEHARRKRSTAAGKEQDRLHSQHYRNTERGKVIKRLNENSRNARKRSLPHQFDIQDWKRALEYFDNCCAVCGRPSGLWHKLVLDHWIPISSPNCPGTIAINIIPLCHGIDGCNNSKRNREVSEWLTERFGKRKAKQILGRIEAYFNWLKERDGISQQFNSRPTGET